MCVKQWILKQTILSKSLIILRTYAICDMHAQHITHGFQAIRFDSNENNILHRSDRHTHLRAMFGWIHNMFSPLFTSMDTRFPLLNVFIFFPCCLLSPMREDIRFSIVFLFAFFHLNECRHENPSSRSPFSDLSISFSLCMCMYFIIGECASRSVHQTFMLENWKENKQIKT